MPPKIGVLSLLSLISPLISASPLYATPSTGSVRMNPRSSDSISKYEITFQQIREGKTAQSMGKDAVLKIIPHGSFSADEITCTGSLQTIFISQVDPGFDDLSCDGDLRAQVQQTAEQKALRVVVAPSKLPNVSPAGFDIAYRRADNDVPGGPKGWTVARGGDGADVYTNKEARSIDVQLIPDFQFDKYTVANLDS